jgi:hypothetical protein
MSEIPKQETQKITAELYEICKKFKDKNRSQKWISVWLRNKSL